MGIIDRKIRQKEKVRASILRSARKTMLSEGWQCLSIRKISDGIEYSIPVIYSHFENKEAILSELQREGFAILDKKLKEVKAGHADPAGRIREMGRSYWDFAVANRSYYQLMFGLCVSASQGIYKIQAIAEFNAQVTRSLKAMIPEGKGLPFDPFLKFQSFLSMLHGLVSIHLFGNPGQQQESLGSAELVLEDLVCGFIAEIKNVL